MSSATIVGIVLLLAAALLTTTLTAFPGVDSSFEWWNTRIISPFSVTSVLTLLLGGTRWHPANRIAGRLPRASRFDVVKRLVVAKVDPLETLLVQALDRQDVLQVTLKSQKVYVGIPATLLNPGPALQSLHLSLVRSGYRDEKHRLHLPVDYIATHERIE